MHISKQKIISWIKKWFSKEESFTILLIPHTPAKKTRSTKFYRWFLSIFIIFNILAFGVVCTFAVSYTSLNKKLKNKRLEYQSLESIKESQEEELSKYKANEDEIKERIQSLISLDEKLKNIINTKESELQSATKGTTTASRSSETSSNTYSRPPSGEFKSLEQMYSTIDTLESQVNSNIQKLNDTTLKIENLINAQKIKTENATNAMNSIPSLMPAYGTITSIFGYRKNPFGGDSEFHKGIDIANKKGTPIKASANGIVTEAGWNTGGYGFLVRINHQNGYESLYGHNSKITVKVGQHVNKGQVIAYMGATGDATGNHCHFEVYLNGKNINPLSVKSKVSN